MDSDLDRKPATTYSRLQYQPAYTPPRKANIYFRITGSDNSDSRWQAQDSNLLDSKPLELQAMQEELFEYRHMLNKLVRERTARLERRISILKYCHDNLVMRHNKLSQMYQELLRKIKYLEANNPG